MSPLARTGLVISILALALGAPVVAYAEPTPQESTPAASSAPAPARLAVTTTTPTDDYSSVTLTITGLRHGQGVRITGAPQGWRAESWYNQSAFQSGPGPLVVTFPGPAGWPEDIPFVWKVTGENGAAAETSFVYRGKTAAPRPSETTQTPKPTRSADKSGGLAKTGV